MNHEKIKEMIQSFYDNELELNDQSLVQDHLNQCSECRDELEEWKIISKTVLNSSDVQSDESFVQKIMYEISQSNQPAQSFNMNPFQKWTLAFSYGLASLILFFSFIHTEPTISVEDLVSPTNNSIETDDSYDILDL